MKLFQLCISLLLTHVIGFTPLIPNKPFLTSAPSSVSSLSATSGTTEEETERLLLDDLRKMRVKELMQELKSAGLRTDDVFEKEELVKRLAEFRLTTSSNKKPSRTSQPQQERRRTTRTGDNIISVPLHFYSLEGSRAVEARNSKDIFIRPSPGKFATITLYLNNNNNSKLTMLVDTACSGVVLRPSSVKKHGLPMQSTNGVSMTSAGGTATGYGLSQLQKFTLEDGSEFRSLPVAVQDIGALPSAIDGIIGLSFLNQFGSVMFDFSNGELLLYNKGNNQADTYTFTTENNLELITESKMQMCKLGIWATECTLDGRGPVKMLVDTGAASTFLNWNGVSDLNMSSDHPLISRNVNMGAMGADNNALALTHRFVLKSRFKLGGIGDTENMFLPGLEVNTLDEYSAAVASSSSPSSSSNVAIDIGDLPVLATLSTEKVNGILGSDILMRADVVLMNLEDRSNLKISLFSKRN